MGSFALGEKADHGGGVVVVTPKRVTEKHLISGIVFADRLFAPRTILVFLVEAASKSSARNFVHLDEKRIATKKVGGGKVWMFRDSKTDGRNLDRRERRGAQFDEAASISAQIVGKSLFAGAAGIEVDDTTLVIWIVGD